MSKTFREINKIDKASQKPLWKRTNPGVKNSGPATKTSGDTRPHQKKAGSLPATKSLTEK